jgi:hypothetical protein
VGWKGPKNFKEVFAMRCLVEFWAVSPEGLPVKKKYEVPAHPMYWPVHPYALVKVEGASEPLIELAEWYGWVYNPSTGTFLR